ncbi:hypothetical protein B0H63DRAFT_489565 [Podospora didyma]|uniref:Uncharacterized protein n=1 Tax=Podospora didyma TaxID=330526 RepID=A0AAE0K0Z5_9PEZI|nr:hypothetical protein B0H63DRAFT_489565 [Podospora didyma]
MSFVPLFHVWAFRMPDFLTLSVLPPHFPHEVAHLVQACPANLGFVDFIYLFRPDGGFCRSGTPCQGVGGCPASDMSASSASASASFPASSCVRGGLSGIVKSLPCEVLGLGLSLAWPGASGDVISPASFLSFLCRSASILSFLRRLALRSASSSSEFSALSLSCFCPAVPVWTRLRPGMPGSPGPGSRDPTRGPVGVFRYLIAVGVG